VKRSIDYAMALAFGLICGALSGHLLVAVLVTSVLFAMIAS